MSLPLTLALTFPNWLIGVLVVLFILISILMVLIVLIQRPQGGGLSAAFGAEAGGSGQTAFGAKTGDALTTGTILIFVLFLVSAVVLNFAVRPSEATVTPTVSPDPTATTSTAPAGGLTTQTPVVPPPASNVTIQTEGGGVIEAKPIADPTEAMKEAESAIQGQLPPAGETDEGAAEIPPSTETPSETPPANPPAAPPANPPAPGGN